MTVKPLRILVTGWRDWPEEEMWKVWEGLDNLERIYFGGVFWPGQDQKITVVQGECPYGGVDKWAKLWAQNATWRTDEPHPAKWRGGKGAGPIRNSEMVAAGADFCLGYPGPGSKGTWDCLMKAVNANIRTYIYPYCKGD